MSNEKLLSPYERLIQGPWGSARRLSPFSRFFDDFFSDTTFPATSASAFQPTVDIEETEKEFVMKVDLPGVKKEDVKVEIKDSRLTISGERREERTSKEGARTFSERVYGSFQRSFDLGNQIQVESVDARYENGVLTLRLPKTERNQSKQIRIQ